MTTQQGRAYAAGYLRVRRANEGSVRTEYLGTPIDLLTFDQTVTRAVEAMRRREPTQHVAMNVAKLVKMRRDPELRRDVIASDIIGIDGMGIVWGARALGLPAAERVAGIDLMERLLAVCADEGFRPYFLGARQAVLERAIEEAARRWPGLALAGCRNGYFGPKDELDVVNAIRESRADCLFIGMPTPRKERFLHEYREVLGVPFIMGVGGSFDVLAGHVERAPAAIRQAGLEWLYRVYQEPRRMWWRYATTNTVYAGLLSAALLRRALPARASQS